MASGSPNGRSVAGASHGDILQLIRQAPAISRSAIARDTGLALSTASLRVDALMRMRLVTEVGLLESQGGRRAIGLNVNAAAGLFGIMLIAPGQCEVRVSDFHGTVLAAKELPRLDLSDPSAAISELHARLRRAAAGHLRPGDDLACICVAVTGPVEYATGTVMSPATLPGWHGVSVKAALRAHTPAPVLVENTSNLEAVAEFAGAAPGARELISVSLGDHIGCGLISGGTLHRGAFGAAGEIGHNAVQGQAVVSCTCTAPNCLESVAGGRALAVRMQRAGLDVASITDVVRLASGDAIAAVEVVREAGRLIGAALAAVVNFFDPEELVLRGPLSRSVPLVRAIRTVVYEHALPVNTAQLSIRVSTAGDGAALQGATGQSLEYLLSADRIDSLLASG